MSILEGEFDRTVGSSRCDTYALVCSVGQGFSGIRFLGMVLNDTPVF